MVFLGKKSISEPWIGPLGQERDLRKKMKFNQLKRKVVLKGTELIGGDRVVSDRHVGGYEFRTCWIIRKAKGSQKIILVHFSLCNLIAGGLGYILCC